MDIILLNKQQRKAPLLEVKHPSKSSLKNTESIAKYHTLQQEIKLVHKQDQVIPHPHPHTNFSNLSHSKVFDYYF